LKKDLDDSTVKEDKYKAILIRENEELRSIIAKKDQE
jgi:hypothetical protein